MTTIDVRRAENLEQVAAAAADVLVRGVHLRQQAGGVPCIVLTGGRGGAALLDALADPERGRGIDWSAVRFVWGDERWLPAGDPERNDTLADRHLFSRVAVDEALVHRMGASDGPLGLDAAAAAYAEIVDGLETIDWAVQGLGEDGHIASLFPGHPAFLAADAEQAAALAVRNSPKPPPERISLSLAALNRARETWLIAAGEGKHEAVEAVRNPVDPRLPGARLAGRERSILWADSAALGG